MSGREVQLVRERVEDSIVHNRLKIQVLREDRLQMLGSHGGLQHDISIAHQQLHQLSAAASKVRDESQSEVNKVYERSLSLESQLRGIEALISEHDQVISHLHELSDSKIKLSSQFRFIHSQLHSLKLDASLLPLLKSDLHALRLELHKGRAAVEFEKKTRSANLEQFQSMERTMSSLTNEVDRLRHELADAHKRARAASASASASASVPDTGYYRAPHNHMAAHSAHYPMHQTVVPVDAASPPLYRHPTGDPVYFDMHQTHGP